MNENRINRLIKKDKIKTKIEMDRLANVYVIVGLVWWSYIESKYSDRNHPIKCGGNLIQDHGEFNTPNYPEVYPNELLCRWNITVDKGYSLRLNFTQFELEYSDDCSYDYVEVKFNNGTTKGRYCGAKNKEPIPPLDPLFSMDNSLEVILKTDFSNEVEVHGFQAHYSAIDIDECQVDNGGCAQFCHNFIGGYHCSCRIGYNLHKDEKQCIAQCKNIYEDKDGLNGTISSPEFPGKYPPLAACDWHIVAKKGYFINLEFIEFHVEDHQETVCPYDYLLIEDERTKIGPFCGKEKPRPFRSASNWLIVEFFSDKSEGFKGFKAKYWLEGIKCPPLAAPDFGYMNGPRNFTFPEEVHFSCEEGYKLHGDSIRKCQADGTWSGVQGNCTRIQCVEPYNLPENGGAEDPVGYPYYVKHKLYIACFRYFDIFGSKVMECQPNTSWTGGDAFCVKTCGRNILSRPVIENCEKGRRRTLTKLFFQPWAVAILEHGKLICNGMLISEEWVLTASHCAVMSPDRFGGGIKRTITLKVGAMYWTKTKDTTQIRTIKKVRVREKFDYGIYDDVMLIQLSSKVKLHRYVQPICIPHEKRHREMFRGGKMVATVGWMNGPLQYLTDRCMQVIPRSQCRNHAASVHKKLHTEHFKTEGGRSNAIPEDLMCTNATVGPSDVCKLMPGAGLVAYDQKSRKWYLGGLLTWGGKTKNICENYMHTYDIYSKISKYARWVKEETRLNLKYPDAKNAHKVKLLQNRERS